MKITWGFYMFLCCLEDMEDHSQRLKRSTSHETDLARSANRQFGIQYLSGIINCQSYTSLKFHSHCLNNSCSAQGLFRPPVSCPQTSTDRKCWKCYFLQEAGAAPAPCQRACWQPFPTFLRPARPSSHAQVYFHFHVKDSDIQISFASHPESVW